MNSETKQMVRKGIADAIPIVVGYIPMGAAYGIIARQSGMEVFPAILMSLIVFAGAASIWAERRDRLTVLARAKRQHEAALESAAELESAV